MSENETMGVIPSCGVKLYGSCHKCEKMPPDVTVNNCGGFYVAQIGAPFLYHGINFCPFCGEELK